MLITISETTPQPPIQWESEATPHLRGWYSMDFIAGDDYTLVLSGNGQTQTGFYYDIECSVDINGYVVIPVFTIQSTTDGNLPLSLFTGQLFDNDNPKEIIFGFQNSSQGWSIPTQLGINVALADLWRYNQATVLFYPPNTYPTYNQMVEYVNLHGGSGYSGPSGYSGFSGVSGYSGFSSVSGYSGFSSVSGYSGYSAASGYSGFSAVSGTSGYSGYTGSSGYSGYSGLGTSGFSGFSGTPGSAVASGYSGFSGQSGFSGDNPGSSGYSGFSGRSGYSGYSGSGTSGYSGIGTSGFSGRSGYSGFSGFSGSGYSGFSGLSGFSGSGGGGAGTVTVVGGGNLTSTAIVTGGGTQLCQTPSVTSTLSAGGSMVLAGTLTTGSGGGTGVVALSAGTFASLPVSPVQGAIAAITNSTTAVWGDTIVGGGSNKVLGWFNGTNWTVIGI